MDLEVRLGRRLVGTLTYSATTDTFDFAYDALWIKDPHGFALSPYIPLPDGQTPRL